jgi:hypothetical protein
LTPLPDIPPYTLCLAIVRSDNDLRLVHLDVCPSGANSDWRLLGDVVGLEPGLSEDAVELVPSQAVQRGLRGLVSVVSKDRGVRLVIMPSISGRGDVVVEEDEEQKSSVSSEAAIGVVLAVRQGVSYADVIRSVFGLVNQGEYTGRFHLDFEVHRLPSRCHA